MPMVAPAFARQQESSDFGRYRASSLADQPLPRKRGLIVAELAPSLWRHDQRWRDAGDQVGPRRPAARRQTAGFRSASPQRGYRWRRGWSLKTTRNKSGLRLRRMARGAAALRRPARRPLSPPQVVQRRIHAPLIVDVDRLRADRDLTERIVGRARLHAWTPDQVRIDAIGAVSDPQPPEMIVERASPPSASAPWNVPKRASPRSTAVGLPRRCRVTR
jgi:hypothetical protein